MNIELSDEKINNLLEKEIQRYVRERVERVMNDGKASWFTQNNIENITRDIVNQKVPEEFIKQVCEKLKTDDFLHCLSDGIAIGLKDIFEY